MSRESALKAWSTMRSRWEKDLGWEPEADQDISFDVQAFDADTRTEGERTADEEERIRRESVAFYRLCPLDHVPTLSARTLRERKSRKGRARPRWAR